MVDTIWGTTNKPAAAKILAERLEQAEDLDATLYIGYPILGTPSGAFPFDAVLLSEEYGVVIFDIVEGTDLGPFQTRQDDFYNKLRAKLSQYPSLVRKRELAAKVTVATFAPRARIDQQDADYPVFDRANTNLVEFIESIEWNFKETYPDLAGAIQSLSNIRKSKRRRDTTKANSRGAKLRKLEDSIANLDFDQGKAVIETVDGVQRIRGLAGSGKTIILALKVAYLHAQHPDWKIAVTFNTRSLKGQFQRLINNFSIEQTSEEPDWDQIEILNAWGAPGPKDRTGIYYKFCAAHGIDYYDFRSARSKFGDDNEFLGVCRNALDQAKTLRPAYDAILVDEAQDFPPEFLRLCHAFLKEPKRLVYAYDELQSLTRSSLPPPEELFGSGTDGVPLVTFGSGALGEPKQDIILPRCYRNSRPILATAHALGFGIYRKGGLVQFFDQHQLWLDVGYAVHDGELEDGRFVSLARTAETSPKFLEAHSAPTDLLFFKSFATAAEQDAWLVAEIQKNLKDDELAAEDIIVINPEPIRTRNAVAASRALLFDAGVSNSLAGVSGSPDVFFESDTVTFTGIFRAKGNEAAMVYVINADDCYDSYNASMRARVRNQLFTAITRSKAWVRVLGVGTNMDKLIKEYGEVAKRDYRLEFEYPDAETRKSLRIISRDMGRKRSRAVRRGTSDLLKIVEALEAGDLNVEDLPEKTRKRLRDLFREPQ